MCLLILIAYLLIYIAKLSWYWYFAPIVVLWLMGVLDD